MSQAQPEHEEQKDDVLWHRILGLLLMERMMGRPYRVRVEHELCVNTRQRLDVTISRVGPPTDRPDPLPDGLEPLAEHTLVSFKSIAESFNDWAVEELQTYYGNYRKQELDPQTGAMVPREAISLVAVSARSPRLLKGKRNYTKELQPGVYDLDCCVRTIRVIVCGEVEVAPRNALWLLFSGVLTHVEYALQHFKDQGQEIGSALNQLFTQYRLEGINVSYDWSDFRKDYLRNHLHELSPQEVLAQYSPKDRLQGLGAADLRSLSAEELQALRAHLEQALQDETKH